MYQRHLAQLYAQGMAQAAASQKAKQLAQQEMVEVNSYSTIYCLTRVL